MYGGTLMFIECYKNNGIPYLRLVRSIRRPSKNNPDKITSYKHTELSIGPLSRFDDGQPDYVKRLKESFKAGQPLIASLKPYCSEPIVPGKYGLSKVEDIFSVSFAHPRYCAQILLDPVFKSLGLSELMAAIKHNSKIKYDLTNYVRLLVYGRILEPASKLATIYENEEFYTPIISDDPYFYHVYDTLDVIYENRIKIMQRMNSAISKGMGRDTSLLFYDVTNFYFEIGDPDPDIEDEDGNFIEKGIRQKGVSKEHRTEPIVQMSMFLDNSGIPVAMNIFPGNTLDHQTAVPTYDQVISRLGFEGKFIFIADKGICTGPIMCRLLDDGNGYIISKSLKKSTQEDREWAVDQTGYTVVDKNFKYKSRIITVSVKDQEGKQRQLKQKSVVYWSRHFYDRDIAEHQSFLDFIKKLKGSPESFRVTKAQAGTLKKFISKDVVNKETGEVLDSRKLLAMIDEKKLEEVTALMGYYQIRTSELDMDDREIIDKYHGLSRIENQFEELKGPLETRPVYVKTKEHIHAHLLICMIALTMIRLIQRKYMQKNPSAQNDAREWTYGLSGKRVQRALQKWKVIPMKADSYWFADVDDADLKAILDSYSLNIPPKLYTDGELRKLKKEIQTF